MQPINVYVDCSGCANCCAHCFAGAGRPYGDLLSVGDCVEVVTKWRECIAGGDGRSPFWWLTFLGEPTTHSRFAALWSYFVAQSRCRDWSVLATSGWGLVRLPDLRPTLTALSRAGVRAYGFALHGDERTHDRFCARRGAWTDVRGAALRLAAARARVWIEIHVSRGNLAHLPELAAEARAWVGRRGRVYCGVPACFPSGNARYEPLRPTVDEVTEAAAAAGLPDCAARPEGAWVEAMARERVRPEHLGEVHEPAVRGEGGGNFGPLVVTSSLDVVEHFASRPAVWHGNIREDGVATIWRRIGRHRLRPLPEPADLARRYGDSASGLAHCGPHGVYLKLMARYWAEEWGVDLSASAPSRQG